MQIKLGDVIRDERGREGAITNIGIATDKIDIAAEADVRDALGGLGFKGEIGCFGSNGDGHMNFL